MTKQFLSSEIDAAQLSTVWFDLDATLYSAKTGVWKMIGVRIELYLHTFVGIPLAELQSVKTDYYLRYGTTLRGLQHHNGVNTQHYLDYVHDIPVGKYIKPDPELRRMLKNLKLTPWVFTNSDQAHAERVLKALGISDCFAGLITVEAIEFECKPNRAAYEAALRISGEPDPQRVLFVDDSVRNLAGARVLGIRTVLVGSESPDANVEWHLKRPHDLVRRLPALFNRMNPLAPS